MDSNLTVEDIMALMVVKFESYTSKSSGDTNTLCTDKLYGMATAEFPTLCTSDKKDEIIKKIIDKMDANNDKRVTFEEFMSFSSSLASVIRNLLKE
ncbi:protein S100-A6-like isoform X2 [Aquarana catesbeiana]|uniref:protein S100-A6-like isoform X1 n=1 Tax=Aquarana catesbeiana TaxID=8400 RepID=UPI003CC94A63